MRRGLLLTQLFDEIRDRAVGCLNGAPAGWFGLDEKRDATPPRRDARKAELLEANADKAPRCAQSTYAHCRNEMKWISELPVRQNLIDLCEIVLLLVALKFKNKFMTHLMAHHAPSTSSNRAQHRSREHD